MAQFSDFVAAPAGRFDGIERTYSPEDVERLRGSVPIEYTLVVKAVVIFAVCLVQSEEFRKAIWRRRVAA